MLSHVSSSGAKSRA